MAPTLITHYEVYSAAADQTTLTTPSFTPSNGEIVVVKLTTWSSTDGMNAPTGGTQSYTLVGTAAPGGFNGWCAVYVATIAGSPGSMTVSSTVATAVNTRHSMVVERWSGAQVDATPATNATKSGTGTTGTTTLTTVSANSVVSWCMTDEQSRDPAASTYSSASGTPTEDGKYDGHIGSNSVQYFVYQDAATAGSQTFGVSNSSSLAWTAVAVEVRAAAAAITGDVSKTFTATLTAAGANSAVGAATETTTATLTAAGANSAVGAVSKTVTATLTAAGTNSAVGGTSASFAAGITAAGTNAAVGAANATTTTSAITTSATVGSVASLTPAVTITAAATVTQAVGGPRTGVMGWDLWSTLAQQASYIDYYRTVPPVACPNDGEPLRSGPSAKAGVLYCPFDGWQYPRDWDPDVHGGM